MILLCRPLELLHLTSKDLLFVLLFPCLFTQKKKSKWYMYVPSLDTFHQTIQRPHWLGLAKTDDIITWQ